MENTNNNIIPNEKLKPQSSLLLAPSPQDSTNYAGLTGGVADSILNEYTNYKTATENLQNTQANTGTDILSLMNEISGKAGATANANETAGVNTATADVNKYAQQLADLNAQASVLNREAQAIPLQVQEQFKNTGATDRGVAPITTGKLRENALRALSIAQQSDIAAAALTGSTIRLQAAKDKAQQIVDLQFKPLEDALALKKQQYELNKDILEKYDKKRSEALGIALKKEEAEIAEKKATAKTIQNLGLTLAQNGVDQSIIQKTLGAKTFEEALTIAGANLRDPKAKYELEKLKLDNALTRERIATEQRQRELMGELTPAEKKAEAQALKQAKTAVPVLQDKISVLDGILNSGAIGSTVGTSTLTRPSKNFIGKVNPFGIPNLIGGLVDKTTGERQLLIGSVNQLVSKEFLDSVLSLKAQGGTLGQITEREGTKLQQAATKIGTWEIRNSKDEVVGYNVSEKDFKEEIKRIKEATNRILIEARGTALQPDEQQLLDNVYGADTALDPASYY